MTIQQDWVQLNSLTRNDLGKNATPVGTRVAALLIAYLAVGLSQSGSVGAHEPHRAKTRELTLSQYMM